MTERMKALSGMNPAQRPWPEERTSRQRGPGTTKRKVKRRSKEQVAAGDVPDTGEAIGVEIQGADENTLGALNVGIQQREAGMKSTRAIIDAIDADIQEEAAKGHGSIARIREHRDRMATLLETREEWKAPDETYGGSDWEVTVVWRSEHGRVIISTERDGSISYHVKRTFDGYSTGGRFPEEATEQGEMLDSVLSWLDAEPKEL